MSQASYPVFVKCGLLVDHTIAAFINLKWAQVNGVVSGNIKGLLGPNGECGPGTEFFERAIKGEDETMNDEGYFSASEAHDFAHELGMEFCYATEFDGSADLAFPDKTKDTSREASYGGDTIYFLEPEKEMTLFAPAYQSPEELMEEYREKLSAVGVPAELDLWPFIVDISGTTFC